jgi:hypothetical protein
VTLSSAPATARSSASGSSSSDAVAALRTSDGHGAGRSPAAARRARGRPTRRPARCTGVAPGSDVRTSSSPAPVRAVQAQPAERVGPQAPDPAGERPAGRQGAAAAVRALDGADDRRHAGGVAERADQPRALRAADLAPARAVAAGAERRAGVPHVGGQAAGGGLAALDAVAQRLAQVVEAVAGQRRDGEDGHVAQPVALEQPPEVAARGLAGARLERVGLVEHDEHLLAWEASGLR